MPRFVKLPEYNTKAVRFYTCPLTIGNCWFQHMTTWAVSWWNQTGPRWWHLSNTTTSKSQKFWISKPSLETWQV